MEGDQNVIELSKERSAKLVKTWPYVVARYAHVIEARDHIQLCKPPKPPISSTTRLAPPHYLNRYRYRLFSTIPSEPLIILLLSESSLESPILEAIKIATYMSCVSIRGWSIMALTPHPGCGAGIAVAHDYLPNVVDAVF
jgi:hypothetical protein